MILALVSTLVSLAIINIRYVAEFWEIRSVLDNGFAATVEISVTMTIMLLTLSDMIPICAQIFCIWLSGKNNWNHLVSGYLRGPRKSELTTECGS